MTTTTTTTTYAATPTGWAALLADAHAAGQAAADAAVPVPMVVQDADVLTGKPVAGGKTYYVPQGVCGFAWVSFYADRGGPSRKFANWLKKSSTTTTTRDFTGYASTRTQGPGNSAGHWGSGYKCTTQFWVSGFGQSYTKKSAYARAFAKVLQDAGYRAYADSRLD